jgi:hypothetical protein
VGFLILKGMEKKIVLCLLTFWLNVVVSFAQDNTSNLTLYREFKPAVIQMTDGKVVKTPFANVFLKNAALLFKRGDVTMEANMATVQTVDIGNHHFVKINNMLASEVDSVGKNKLYCATLIDLDSYKAMLRNDVNITNLSIGDQLSYTTVDLSPTEGMKLPLIRQFFYLYNGEMIRVHEREISRRLPKEKKRMYKTVISMEDFSWVDATSLLKLLRFISEE